MKTFYFLESRDFTCELNACTFLFSLAVKASEVGARYAVISWRTSTVVYHSYRLIYQVTGEETKVINIPALLPHSAQTLREFVTEMAVLLCVCVL